MLQFDSRGYLLHDRHIPLTLEEFHQAFVLDLPSENRKRLFAGFLGFFRDMLNDLALESVLIWVNGSFVTRKENPNDIDLVYFLHAGIVERFETILCDRFSYPESVNLYEMDAYLIRLYQEDHLFHIHTVSDRAHWIDFFTKTRKNRRGTAHKKGFLEINIHRHEIQ